jgi:hypothetical protein
MRAKQVWLSAFVIGGITFAGSAMAQGVDVGLGVGLPLAPGANGTSPGQIFNSARVTNPTTALPPGQAFIQTGKPAGGPPPGQSFTNYGRSK